VASAYDSAIALAKRLIDKKGRAVKIRRPTGTALVDPAKPWLGPVDIASETSTKAVFTSMRDLEPFVRLASGRETPTRTPTEAGASVALVPASGLSFEIEIDMLLVDGVTTHNITGIEKLQPGDAPVLYILTLAR
jgi:hypothetical protein